jgi:hypothetical protein
MNVIIFSDFSDIQKPHTITIDQALARIRDGKSKDKVLKIRDKLTKGEDYEDDKKSLPCVLFSASKVQKTISKRDLETYREDASIVEHSGFFTLDWDKCNTATKLEQLKSDPYIFAAWLSVTGQGVRALVKCPPSKDNHNLYYTAFLDRYPELDSTSRNISRVAFESFDPLIWVNQRALVWDKRLSEEERKKNKEKEADRRGKSVISTAVGMIRSANDGEKHETLLKASNLVGGYIAAGRVNEEDAVKILEAEIRAKNPKDIRGALQTIADGISYGMTRPLAEAKKIEKGQQFLRREDGTYDFLADEREMDSYLMDIVNGSMRMGLSTGLNNLDPSWMFKENHLVFMAALDGVGKSHLAWYLGVNAAKYHNWPIIINAGENSDGQVRKKLMEFYMNKPVKVMDDEELTISRDFVKRMFRIISSKNLHTMEDFLFKCEVVIDEGFDAKVVIGEPYNSYDVAVTANLYMTTVRSLNLMRVFKENYCSLWITDHIGTQAARKKDKDGFIEVPWKSDVSEGQIKCNKCDDFLILHRIVNHPTDFNKLQIHVAKIRDIESGGFPTKKDEPVIVEISKDYCNYISKPSYKK